MQTIELPASVRIGPFDYAVNPAGYHIDGRAMGHCDHRRLEICVDETLPPMQMADTYLHEVLHGIWRTFGLGDEASEEGAVHTLATGLLDFILYNPNGLDPLHEAIGIARRSELSTRLTGGLIGHGA